MGRWGGLRPPAHADPGGGPERRAGREREGRMGRGGDRGPETPAGPAGTRQVRWEQRQVPCAGGAWRQGARCALAPELSPEPGLESLLGLQTFPQSVLLGHCWILPYTRLVLALVMLLSPRCFLSPSSLCACLPGLPGGPGPAALLRGAVGFVLSLLCRWLLLRCPNWVEKLFWGRETSCPFYFGASPAATLGHIAVVKT